MMPGDMIFHNANSIHNDSLEWKFDITNLSENNYPIFAESRLVNNKNLENYPTLLGGHLKKSVLIQHSEACWGDLSALGAKSCKVK